jgi:pyridoxamine 5'-phosphate oxidase
MMISISSRFILEGKTLMTSNFEHVTNPFILFGAWFKEAQGLELNDPNAMTLATVDDNGWPNARIVLLKDYDENGFVFYTNTTSTKGQELAHHPHAALVFHWKSLLRQVRVRGSVVPVSSAEADAYFASRAYISRIGAHASLQSQQLEKRATLEARVDALKAQYPEIEPVPRPPHWSGFRVVPVEIEFWADRPFRLHDRIRFERADGDKPWDIQRLYP